MYAARTIIAALATLMLWHELAAAGANGLVCGHALSWKAPGASDGYRPIRAPATNQFGDDRALLRVEPRGDEDAREHIYLILVGPAAAHLILANAGTGPAEVLVSIPARVIVLCAEKPISWLAGTRPGQPLTARRRAKLDAWAGRIMQVRPKGLGPEIHRPDYEGFEAVAIPDAGGAAALLLDLRP